VQDPYQINNVSDVIQLGTTPADEDKSFRLTRDIDLSGKTWTQAVIPEFSGIFDGNGHVVRNLTINGSSNLGLFGTLAITAQVRDLVITEASVTGSGAYVGALAGENLGCVSDCGGTGKIMVTSTDSNGVGGLIGVNCLCVTNCTSALVVSAANSDSVGGLVGLNSGSIVDCSSTGAVSGKDHVGGLVGTTVWLVSRCYSTATVAGSGGDSNNIGGLVGSSDVGAVINCYSTGAVTCMGARGIAGGLAGHNAGSLVNCYSTGRVTGTGILGGLVGETRDNGTVGNGFWDIQASGLGWSSGGTGKTTAQMKEKRTYCDTDSPKPDPNACWDFINETKYGTSETWQMPSGGGYPVLSVFNGYHPLQQLRGRGTPEDPYLISTPKDLGAVCYDPLSCYKLASDVDLSDIQWSAPVVPEFWGTFDGNHFAIRNLNIPRGWGSSVGLFGALMQLAQVKDLGMVGVTVASSEYCVSGLAGFSYGRLVSCFSSGTVTATGGRTYGRFVGGLVGTTSGGCVISCHSSAVVTAQGATSSAVGGLLGDNWGTIVINCYSTGMAKGWGYVGGLMGGISQGSVVNCYSTATVESSGADSNSASGGLLGANLDGSVVNCYSTGSVTGEGYVGGLVGYNGYGSVSNCYSAGKVTGTGDGVGGLIGVQIAPGGLEVFPGISVSLCGGVSNSFWDKQASGCDRSACGIGLSTDQMTDCNTFLGAGWDFLGETKNGTSEIWQMSCRKEYPVLSVFNGYQPPLLKGKGTVDDPYLISTKAELGAVCYRPESCYRLAVATSPHTIDLSGIQWSTAVIPALASSFDGNGCTISNLKIRGGGHLGLFGTVKSGIKNLGVTGVDVVGTGQYVGGLAGCCQDCVSGCYSSGSITGQAIVGGLFGSNSCNVSNCYSTAKVTATLAIVGGLIGENTSMVDKCYSTGGVTMSPSMLSMLIQPGGLIGDDGTFMQTGVFLGGTGGGNGVTTNSVWNTETSGCNWSAGGDGLPTYLMMRKKTYLDRGWDIVDMTARSPDHIWWINDTFTYPHFWWEPVKAKE
jgi:hypothetical protein